MFSYVVTGELEFFLSLTCVKICTMFLSLTVSTAPRDKPQDFSKMSKNKKKKIKKKQKKQEQLIQIQMKQLEELDREKESMKSQVF